MQAALPPRLCRLYLLPCIPQLPLQITCVLHCSLLLLVCCLSLQGQVTTTSRNMGTLPVVAAMHTLASAPLA